MGETGPGGGFSARDERQLSSIKRFKSNAVMIVNTVPSELLMAEQAFGAALKELQRIRQFYQNSMMHQCPD
jgi:hypothetical protein